MLVFACASTFVVYYYFVCSPDLTENYDHWDKQHHEEGHQEDEREQQGLRGRVCARTCVCVGVVLYCIFVDVCFTIGVIRASHTSGMPMPSKIIVLNSINFCTPNIT